FGPGDALGSPLPSAHTTAAGWKAGPTAPFARLEMATAVLGGRIWLAGGFNPDGSATDEVAILDPATGEWTDGPRLPAAVHHAALAADGDQLFLIGGYLGSTGEVTDAVHVLDPADGVWESGPSLPEPRAAGAATHDGSRIVYGGGVGPGGVRDDVFVLASDEWSRIGALARTREHLAATTDGEGRSWFLGGRQGGLDRNVGDVDLVEGTSITLLATLSPRGGVAAFLAPEIGACLTGGEAPSFANATVECVDATGRVTALPDMIQRRHGHGAAVIDGIAYLLLGGEEPGLSASATVETLELGE
ncbi:MAG: kelch repeat-containing protein, partial [Candidatus Limnocylindria bacterium]